MRYRLPLELELTILELAAPPLAFDRLHDRVDFFIKISLVHRSWAAWAQDRLRAQFLYTYHRRPDEHARLNARFEAGFGRDRLVRRLYLDLSRLPPNIDNREESRPDSVSATINGRVCLSISAPGNLEQVGTTAQGRACEAVAHYVQNGTVQAGRWEVCAMITAFSQTLDTLWLKLPIKKLDIADLPPPRVLHVDDGAVDDPWGWFGLLPLASETVLFLRNIGFDLEDDPGVLDTRHLILDQCWAAEISMSDFLGPFHHLETLVLFKGEAVGLVSTLTALPPTMRPDRGSQKLADDDRTALSQLQQVVESIIDAPQCTFKYVRSTESPEDALAGALSALKLDL